MNITVTMQKNVLVDVDNLLGDRRIMQLTHSAFFKWLNKTGVKSFLFRPSDKSNTDLIARRVSRIERAGFVVSPSNNVHHFMLASK